MSRVAAGFGGVVGAVAGGVLGIVLGEHIPPQPGFTPHDDKALVNGVGAVGAAIGMFVGAFVGAGPDCVRPGTVGELPPSSGRTPVGFP